MKRLLFTIILAGAMLVSAQATGEMLFTQGCDAFDLVEDLGVGPDGATHWIVRSLKDGRELPLAFDTVEMLTPPSDDPTKLDAKGYVAWKFEGTGIQGTNLTRLVGTIDASLNFTGFCEGEVFRGTVYKSGGLSCTVSGNLATGLVYDAARFVFCRAGFGGRYSLQQD